MMEQQLTEREAKTLDILCQPVRRRMLLSTFKTKFLPFLSNQPIPQEVVDEMLGRMSRQTGQQHTVADLHGNLLSEWTEAVGSAYVEVEVVADNNSNSPVLYVVPPLLANRDVIIDGVEGSEIARLVEQASNQALVHANLGTQFIKEHLLPLIRQPSNNPEHEEMWNRIFRYHDLPLIGEEVHSQSNTKQSSPDDHRDPDKIYDLDDFGD